MSTKFKNGLFIFRRDLRIVDNNGLNLLNSNCENIYAVFIFTPEQVGHQNEYKSDNAIQFMIESLKDLDDQIKDDGGKLHCFYGPNTTVLKSIIEDLHIETICFNLDYTPYAIKRDTEIMDLCQKMGVVVQYAHDYYLHEPGSILTGSGTIYQKFTPYYNAAKSKRVQIASGKRKIGFAKSSKQLEKSISLNSAMDRFTKINPNILVHGGRENGLKQMKIATKNIEHYSKTRDELSKPTSQLSAYIKFGCVSIREVYERFRSKTDFIRQLYWRSFYINILYAFPRLLGHALKPKYDKIRWKHNERWFDAWKNGETGIPLVDASQRQLLQCGWTHNRGRMISSSILTKILLIDWRKGEKFYAQHLVDYDVANNNGGWQWSAGTGADAQVYYRYFNPYLQSETHDPECEYIKRWVPQLKDVPAKDIHDWENTWINYKDIEYPKPIVNYKEQKEKSLKIYKDALY
jgi:deoxyribodipyrimidine photo-lyase